MMGSDDGQAYDDYYAELPSNKSITNCTKSSSLQNSSTAADDYYYAPMDDDVFLLYNLDNKHQLLIVGTVGASINIPSLFCGLFLVLVMLDISRVTKSRLKDFDKLVLALTFWQFFYDFDLLLAKEGNPWRLLHMMCVPGCMKSRVMKYEHGYDSRPEDDNIDDNLIYNYNNYGILWEMFTQVFLFTAYIASGLVTNVITYAVWIIVYKSRRPALTRYFWTINVAILLVSLFIPLIILVWWFDGIPGYPPFLTYSGHEDMKSQIFQGNLILCINVLAMSSMMFNFIGCISIFYLLRGYTQVGINTKGGALAELRNRLVLYPIIQVTTRISTITYFFLYHFDQSGFTGSGWGHTVSTTQYRVLHIIRSLTNGAAGVLFVFVWFTFNAQARKHVRWRLSLLCSLLNRKPYPEYPRARSNSSTSVSSKKNALSFSTDHIPTQMLSDDKNDDAHFTAQPTHPATLSIPIPRSLASQLSTPSSLDVGLAGAVPRHPVEHSAPVEELEPEVARIDFKIYDDDELLVYIENSLSFTPAAPSIPSSCEARTVELQDMYHSRAAPSAGYVNPLHSEKRLQVCTPDVIAWSVDFNTRSAMHNDEI